MIQRVWETWAVALARPTQHVLWQFAYLRVQVIHQRAERTHGFAIAAAKTLDYATRRSVTTGKCFRPPRNSTCSSNCAPGLPRTSAHGLAAGDPRGQLARGS